jgi:hypothetical protein
MRTDLTFRPEDCAQAVHVPLMIVTGVATLTSALVKDVLQIEKPKDLYRVCGFETSKRDPVRKARTVLATAFTTMTPNFIVLGVDASQSRMLFHQIEPTEVPPMTKKLGAKG